MDASPYYISVHSLYLFDAYELVTGNIVQGKILKVMENGKEILELKGKNISLILKRSGAFDDLFISKKGWEENFRELGLVGSGYNITLRLEYIVRTSSMAGEKVPLYSKRDVEI